MIPRNETECNAVIACTVEQGVPYIPMPEGRGYTAPLINTASSQYSPLIRHKPGTGNSGLFFAKLSMYPIILCVLVRKLAFPPAAADHSPSLQWSKIHV